MIDKDVFQAIYDELVVFLPVGWTRLVAYFEYGTASYSFAFYVKGDGKYVKCYDIPDIDEDKLLSSFAKIDDMLSVERKNDAVNTWSNMTMIVDNDGSIHTDFDYTDLSDIAYQYKKAWKAKYLR